MATAWNGMHGLLRRSEVASNSLRADLSGVAVSSWEEYAKETRPGSIVLAQIGLVHIA